MELQILLFFFIYCLSTAWFLCFSKAADQVDFSNEISALLSIKAGFIDPTGHLQDWKFSNNSTNHCNWTGVQCNSINGYVEKLHLSNMNLTGTISVEIQQLQNLAYFNICSNGFSSQLPKSLSNLTKLKIVDLSDNYFYGFPDGLGLIDGLVYLNASVNSFSGYLPNDLGNATSLEVLDLSGNYFEGSIPVSYKNMMKLKFLGLTGNNLTGLIPSGLGEISSLETIMIGYNGFNSGIPVEFGNLTNLKCLDIAYGNLGGSIPDELGKLQKLEIIFLFENNLVGKIPKSLGNLTSLQQLDLSDNMLSEQIPVELTNLKNLWLLNLMCNNLSGTIPEGFSVLTRLQILALWNNNLTGTLPSDLGLNSPLQSLDISNNSITGLIPTCLCNQGNLTKIIMFNNQLTGPIPANLSVCASLVRVRMHNNLLSGTIPIGFGKLGQLQRLELANNSLSGQIPYDLSSSTTLNFIDFSQNQLQYSVPSSILTIPTLESFLVAKNNLVGQIPDVFQDYPTLSELDLSSNHFSGVIPSTISSCEKLVTLNLRNNRFSGPIPTTLATMSALAVLDLSNNSLTGAIPVNFGNSPALETFNVSHNNLEGPIPENGLLRTINTEDLIGNSGLCGGVLPPCSRNLVLQKRSRIKHAISGWLIATSTILVLIVACIQGRILYKKWYNNGSCFENRIEAPWRLIAFQRLEIRTKDILICLKESNIIGTGANGVVYKAELDILKTVVAVKKLRRSDSNDIVGEVNLLGGLRHRNIVRLLGFLHNDTDAMIICEYLPNGSLWEALHGKDVVPSMVMDWVSRYNIAMGVAQGLSYLHQDCYPPVIHRDIKSNNILLDENLEAKIADFGLAKMMVIKNETVSVVAGSYGYIAPEYGYTLKVDEKIDIYSYGVVLMELLTGKKPLDSEFGEAIDIVEWIRNNKPLESALDKNIGITKLVEEEMLLVLRIALLCTEKLPKDRPSMRDVITMLGEAKPRRKSVCNNGY